MISTIASQFTGNFDCLFNRLVRRTSQKIPKIRVTGLGFLSQRTSDAVFFFHLMTLSYPILPERSSDGGVITGMEICLGLGLRWISDRAHVFSWRYLVIYYHWKWLGTYQTTQHYLKQWWRNSVKRSPSLWHSGQIKKYITNPVQYCAVITQSIFSTIITKYSP